MLKLISAALATSIITAFSVAAEPSVNGSSEGIAAYRVGDYATAWDLLTRASIEGDIRAKRYLANIILSEHAPSEKSDMTKGVEFLMDAARAGDNAALIKLEELRQSAVAYAPTLSDIISVELHRAENGDPISAWRLAKRYEFGEGVAPSRTEMTRWLKVVAETDHARFPKSNEAAFRLCELHVAGDDETYDPTMARRWCAQAAKNGSAAAAIVLRRLAQLSG